jgi:perosamine synthetase
MSWFVYVIRLNEKRFFREDRDKIMQKLKEKGIACSNYFPPIHLEPFYIEMFGYKKGSLPITERISGLTIALPFYNNLTEGEVDYVCKCLKKIIK